VPDTNEGACSAGSQSSHATHREGLRTGFALLGWMTAWLVLLAGCGQTEPPLRVGNYPWPGFATLYYARALGLLDPARVRLVDFDNAGEVMSAFREGRVDAADLTLDEAVTLAQSGEPGHVVMVFGFSKGGDALLARPPISSLDELRGLRIGIESKSEGGYMLARILNQAGLTSEDVFMVELPLNEHERAYQSGLVDALITMDPVRSRLLATGANELFTSSQIGGELVDILLVNEKVLNTHPRALQDLVNCHFRALDKIRDDPGTAAQQLGSRFGAPGEVLGTWELIEFAGRGANDRLLGEGDLLQTAKRIQSIMRKQGLASGETGQLPTMDDRFVRSGGG
jgi:NitT/TauT family transport system substrate-binding protein